MAFLVRDTSHQSLPVGAGDHRHALCVRRPIGFRQRCPAFPGSPGARDRRVGHPGRGGRRLSRYAWTSSTPPAPSSAGPPLAGSWATSGTVHGKIFAAFKSPEGRQAILAEPLLPRTSDTPHRSGNPVVAGTGRAWPARAWPTTSRALRRAPARWGPRARPVRRRRSGDLGGHAHRAFRAGRKSPVHPSGQEGRHVVLSLPGLDSWKVRHLVLFETTIDWDYVQR